MTWVGVLISLGLFALGCGMLWVRLRWLCLPLALLATLLAVLSSSYYVADHFTGQGINESVIYHLTFGLQGAGFREYLGIMLLAGVLLLVSLAYGGALWWLLRRAPPSLPRFAGWVAMPLLALAWVVNPAAKDLVTVGHQYVSADTGGKLPDFFVEPGGLNLREEVERPKNLVLIYAESLERAYFNDEVFPALVPNLADRESRALSFTGIEQLPGMWWTMGGKVGSQCGMPLVTTSGIDEKSSAEQYLPGARCLGDLLAERDYELHYMGGANSEFAGKKGFYLTHGFDLVEGFDQLSERVDGSDNRNHWGLHDDETFSLVADRFDALASKEGSFALTTLTLGTHHPRGHMSPSCETSDYAAGDDPMLQAVHCSDRLIDELVEHIEASPHAEDTLVVVMSDHVAMKNTVSEELEGQPRRNLFMVWGEGVTAGLDNRAGSQLDMGPTLLSLMGFEIEALGLGRNLLGEQENFVETYDDSHAALRDTFPRLRTLWGVENLAKGLTIDTFAHEVVLGTRRFDLPLILQLDEQLAVDAVLGDSANLGEIPDDAFFVWVDLCRRNSLQAADRQDICMRWGQGTRGKTQRLIVDSGSHHVSNDVLRRPEENNDVESGPALENLLPILDRGGRVYVDGEPMLRLAFLSNDSNEEVILEAKPNAGMGFVRWWGIDGHEQFDARIRVPSHRVDALEPEFDQAVEARGAHPVYRSAWVGVASHEAGRLAERLSPGDSSDSIARVALWQEGIGSIDLRGVGGFRSSNPTGFIRVNGETIVDSGRGLHLVVLDSQGGVKHVEHFDTNASESESDALAATLEEVKAGQLVLLASADEFTNSLTPRLYAALANLGFALKEQEK